MKEEQGVPVSEEVLEVLRREEEQSKGITLEDFFIHTLSLRINNFLISYGDDGWQCSCHIGQEHQTCRHLMALKLLTTSLDLKDLAEGFKKE